MAFSSLVHVAHRRSSIEWLLGNWKSVSYLPSKPFKSHLLPRNRSAQSHLSRVLVCFYPSKVPGIAGEAPRPEGAGRGSLLLRGHCPQSNLWANQACSQFNLFKLVSESTPAAHKHLLQAYDVQGMALNVLWLSINAEGVGLHRGEDRPKCES